MKSACKDQEPEVRRRLKWSEIDENTDIALILNQPQIPLLHAVEENATAKIAVVSGELLEVYLDTIASANGSGSASLFPENDPVSSSLEDIQEADEDPDPEAIVMEPSTTEAIVTSDDSCTRHAEIHTCTPMNGKCIPCKFFVSRIGCHKGEMCIYCHAPHPELSQGQRRRLMSKANRKKHHDDMLQSASNEKACDQISPGTPFQMNPYAIERRRRISHKNEQSSPHDNVPYAVHAEFEHFISKLTQMKTTPAMRPRKNDCLSKQKVENYRRI